MDVKQQLFSRAMGVLQDPRVAKALSNPKVMQGVVGALKLRGEVQRNLQHGLRALAKGLNLATAAEVKELKRALARLERELEQERSAKKPARHKERASE